MDDAILTFDIGTSSVKAGLFTVPDGHVRWLHREALSTGGQGAGELIGAGTVDAPPDAWVVEQWVAAIRSTIDQLPDGLRLVGLALSGNGPTVVPVNRDRTALTDVLLWHDSRETRVEGASSFFLPKIRWIADHRPEVYARAWMFMTCPEYLAFLMGSVPHSTSPSGAFDPYVWDATGATAYGVDEERLPSLVRPAAEVGRVTADGANVFGLPVGVPIYAGGPDFLMSLLGTATVTPGTTCDRAGTSEGINYCAAEPLTGNAVRCLPHIVPGLWNVAGVLSSTGRIFEWFRTISRQRSVGYERMLAEIAAAGYEHEPYFFPSMHHGAAWEFSRGMVAGLRSDHGAPQMGRGVVHAIGYAVRQSIDSLRSVGCEIVELRACGGQAKNAVWNQMKADITGLPVVCPEVRDAELSGSACCVLAGLGYQVDPWDAAARVVRFDERYEPEATAHDRFSDGYHDYLQKYRWFLDAMAQIEGSTGRPA